MSTPAILNLVLQRGVDEQVQFTWSTDNGWAWWTPSTAHAVGDVVKVFPDLVQIVAPVMSTDGRTLLQPAVTTPGLFLRCTAAGTSSATPPAVPTVPGNSVVDNTVTWIIQGDDSVPVNVTGYTFESKFRSAPDALDPWTLDLTNTSFTITNAPMGMVSMLVTKANKETLLAAWSRGYYDVLATPPSGPQSYPIAGVVTFYPASTR